MQGGIPVNEQHEIDLGAIVDVLSEAMEMMKVLINDVYFMISKLEDVKNDVDGASPPGSGGI
jgi:hypothetical protein